MMLRGAVVLAAFGYAAVRMAAPTEVSLSIPSTTSKITIKEGDLLTFDGHKLIATSEFFFSQLGNHVATGSLLGRFITRFFGGDPTRLRLQQEQELRAHSPVGSPTSSPPLRYPIGTTIGLQMGAHKAFLCALSHVDLPSLKAHADLADLTRALTTAWGVVHTQANGEPVGVALMGSGQSGVALSKQDLLVLLLLSIREASGKRKITNEIIIHLDAEAYKDIDLQGIEENWRP